MFDIRVPVGILVLLLGALLAVFGLVSGSEIYRTHSLGVNLNLISGIAMVVFGGFSLTLSRIKVR